VCLPLSKIIKFSPIIILNVSRNWTFIAICPSFDAIGSNETFDLCRKQKRKPQAYPVGRKTLFKTCMACLGHSTRKCKQNTSNSCSVFSDCYITQDLSNRHPCMLIKNDLFGFFSLKFKPQAILEKRILFPEFRSCC